MNEAHNPSGGFEQKRQTANMAEASPSGKKLKDLKVVDLKAELGKRGLATSGVKVILTERLSKYLEEEEKTDPNEHVFGAEEEVAKGEEEPIAAAADAATAAEDVTQEEQRVEETAPQEPAVPEEPSATEEAAAPEVPKKLKDLKVVHLKAELEKRGLATSGVKVILTDRLSKFLEEEEQVDPNKHVFGAEEEVTKEQEEPTTTATDSAATAEEVAPEEQTVEETAPKEPAAPEEPLPEDKNPLHIKMSLSSKQISFIDSKISEGVHKEGDIIEPHEQDTMAIILFNPLEDQNLLLKCPYHQNEYLTFSSQWTYNCTNKAYASPRLIYSLGGNVLLISAIYRCSKCEKPLRAHHPQILDKTGVKANFHLFQKSGVTKMAYDMVVNLVQSGMTFTEISNFFERSHGLKIADPNLSAPEKFRTPERKFIMDVFLKDFRQKLPYYEKQMASIKPLHLSADHTFKVSTLLKFKNDALYSRRMSRPFSALYLMLDEGARVVAFTLTRTKSLEEIGGNLMELYHRAGQPKMVHSDNCCNDSSGMRNIFGNNTLIKLDVFHGLSRVTREVKKKDLSVKQRKLFNNQLSLCVRQNGDWSKKRRRPTASKTQISNNLEQLKLNWKEKIPKAATHAIDNLLQHARNGCLSQIPVGQGTNKNELLHKHLRRFLCGRPSLGAETLIALLTTFFYRWNCRQSGISSFVASANEVASIKNEDEFPKGLFGFPYKAQDKPKRTFAHNIDQSDVLDIIEATERLASLGQAYLKSDLPLNVEDVLLKSPYKSPSTTSNSGREYFEVDRTLSAMGLRRIDIEKDGNCLFRAVSTQIIKRQPDDHYENFLESIGMRKNTNISEVAAVLRNLTVKELLNNYNEYKKCFPQMNITSYRTEVSRFYQDGEFAGLIGDILVPGLANVLRTTFTLYCDNPQSPIQLVKPRKRALNSETIEIAFMPIGPGHYDAVGKSVKANLEQRMRKQKQCRCGRTGNAACVSRLCPCYNSEISCGSSPTCICVNCSNKFGKRGTTTDNVKPCSCGRKLKEPPSNNAPPCSTTKCKCFLRGEACSDCICKFCSNSHGKQKVSESGSRKTTKKSTASKHCGKLPRTASLKFIRQKSEGKIRSHWKLTESILLTEIFKNREQVGDASLKTVTKWYNHIVKHYPHLGGAKNELQISHKLKNLAEGL